MRRLLLRSGRERRRSPSTSYDLPVCGVGARQLMAVVPAAAEGVFDVKCSS